MTLAIRVSKYFEGTMSTSDVLSDLASSRPDRLAVVKAFIVLDREIRNCLAETAGEPALNREIRDKAGVLLSDALEVITNGQSDAAATRFQGHMFRRYFSGPYPVYRDIASRNPKLRVHKLEIEGLDCAMS